MDDICPIWIDPRTGKKYRDITNLFFYDYVKPYPTVHLTPEEPTEQIKHSKYTSEQEVELIELYTQGNCYEDIAKETGRTVASIESRVSLLRREGRIKIHF